VTDHPVAERTLLDALLGDGRPAIVLTGFSLIFSGGFALFLGISREFLPQDVAYLHMTANQLCRVDGCRMVDFMIHDRVAFGGSLMAIGSLYVWLALFPLAQGRTWAWHALAVSGTIGFGSFLTYLGYGYLDTWHGIGTLLLLPIFVTGMVRSRRLRSPPIRISALLHPEPWGPPLSTGSAARALMLVAAGGMAMGGLIVMLIGVTAVFVPQDLGFMGTTKAALDGINPHLVPLMAHDRAGFGGGVCATGVTTVLCLWCARPSRTLWQVLLFAWLALAGSAIGVHFAIGYTSPSHVGPAILGATLFGIGLLRAHRPMASGRWS
jgi:hypothetical protein